MKGCCCLIFGAMWLIAGILCMYNGNYPEIGLKNYKEDHHIVSRTKVSEYKEYEDKKRNSDDAWKFEIYTINPKNPLHKCEDKSERLSYREAEHLEREYPYGKNVTVYEYRDHKGDCMILNTSGLKAAAIAGIVLLSPFALVIGVIGFVLTLWVLVGIVMCLSFLVQAVFCCHNKDTEAKTVELPEKSGLNAV